MGNPSRVNVVGPLLPYVGGFRAELESQGSRPNAVSDQLRLMVHVSRWLAANGFGVAELTSARVDAFLVARRAAGYVLWRSPKGIAPLLTYLRDMGAVPLPEPATVTTAAEHLLAHYRTYLMEERGHERARTDASGVFTERLISQRRASTHTVAAYRDASALVGQPQIQRVYSVRFPALRHPEHAASIDRVLAIPPKRFEREIVCFLTDDEVDALLAAPDRKSFLGRRDHALLLVAIQTGLRVSELIGLKCHDVVLVGLTVKHLPPDDRSWKDYWKLYCLQRMEVRDNKKLFESNFVSLSIDGV